MYIGIQKRIETKQCNEFSNSAVSSENSHKGLIRLSSKGLESNLSHTIGNTLNELIFGMTYKENDPVWNRIQNLREEGIKVKSFIRILKIK